MTLTNLPDTFHGVVILSLSVSFCIELRKYKTDEKQVVEICIVFKLDDHFFIFSSY